MTDSAPDSTRGTILGRGRGRPPSEEITPEPAESLGGPQTVALDPAPAPAGDEPDWLGAGPRTTAGRAARWPLVGCVVLGMAALVFALLAVQQRSSLRTEQDQTAELRDVSGRTIAALTSYDYQHLDQWKKSVLANATGSFQNQFETGFSGFEQTYIAEHNRATGAIGGVWVGPVASGKATTVVLVQITVTSLTGTHTLEPYVQVTLLKVAGRWRVDDVQATFDTGGGANSGSTAATTPPSPAVTAPPGSTPTSSP